MSSKKIKVIDLFCGIGGLSHGLVKEGLDVVAGIDNDGDCKFGYEYNNKARFICEDILKVTASDINEMFGNKEKTIRVLAGCAPCQPFSKLNLKKVTEKQLQPLEKFACLIEETQPDIVSMENVSGLADKKKYPIFDTFIKTLEKNGYQYKYEVVDVSEYGVPQRRKRLVLLASKFGEIALIKRTHKNKKVTVRDVISGLEPIGHGEASATDPLHRARTLNATNLKRVKATPCDGGNSSSWSKDLVLKCHKAKSGKTYQATVYGRMRWDDPAPTMTTHCTGLGNGRFGHPEQNRAISLREAALFQTFPKSYKFTPDDEPIVMKRISKFIGNAVPVKLGSVIGKSIREHVDLYGN
ncbi:MAG: DNA cytosine methyltransferase [Patescibacteria group bacterium]|nr:DNA cytosine methyltransferase [Patescibacteria group bacterium]